MESNIAGTKHARAARRNLAGGLVADAEALDLVKAEKAKRSDPRTPTLAFTSFAEERWSLGKGREGQEK